MASQRRRRSETWFRAITMWLGAAALLAGCATSATALPKSPLKFPGTTTLSRPAGDGPFPAVVLLHTCAGRSSALDQWAAKLTSAGYVALIIDSLGPRGAANNCGYFAVSVDDVAGDALAAAAYLRTLPFVDGSRIGAMGFSYGAMAGLRLASAGYMNREAPAKGFQAIIAAYPYCMATTTAEPFRSMQNNFYDDVGTPLLLLIGSADDETDPGQCVARAQSLQAGGEPVSYKLYPGVTHAFDQPSPRDGIRVRGHFYRYDAAATEDATRRMDAFFGKYLKGDAER